jgi:hypothetical protein
MDIHSACYLRKPPGENIAGKKFVCVYAHNSDHQGGKTPLDVTSCHCHRWPFLGYPVLRSDTFHLLGFNKWFRLGGGLQHHLYINTTFKPQH